MKTMRVVFDLDGTLIDSARDLADAASELVQEYGAAPLPTSEVETMIGEGAAVLVRRSLERAGLDPATPGALDRFLAIYDRRLLDHTVAYAGVGEVLALLGRHGSLAVLTNKPLAPARAILDALGLIGFFDEVLGGDGRFPRKPDPTGLLALLQGRGPHDRTRDRVEFAFRATGGILIGDSPIDAATAQAAGCPFVLARYGFGAARFQTTSEFTFAADHPRELVSIVARIASYPELT
jgi:phosphoglycolate phosphatase